jgi:glucose-6-phosphate-specific signal transduction histidine kinase
MSTGERLVHMVEDLDKIKDALKVDKEEKTMSIALIYKLKRKKDLLKKEIATTREELRQEILQKIHKEIEQKKQQDIQNQAKFNRESHPNITPSTFPSVNKGFDSSIALFISSASMKIY